MVSFIEHIAPKPVTSVEKYHTFKSLSKQAWPKCLWPILLFACLGKLFSGFFKILIRFSYLSIYWVSIKTYIFSISDFAWLGSATTSEKYVFAFFSATFALFLKTVITFFRYIHYVDALYCLFITPIL